jgi:glycosyltransferase involved in cell wall biosynthesis
MREKLTMELNVHRSMEKIITICIPTCNRNLQLKRLLVSLSKQEHLPENYEFEILLINNDCNNHLEPIIDSLKNNYPFPIHSIVVDERGYSNVRNAAVAWVLNRKTTALIFIDDDEIAPPVWLANMILAWKKYGGDIVTGPVEQLLPASASGFFTKLHLLGRNHHAKTGTKLKYANSNNTLISRKVLTSMGLSFHPDLNFTGGEDTLFFHQCYLNGFSIYWDNTLLIQEPTLPERATVLYVIKRWFRYGSTRIILNRILYPDDWKRVSYRLIIATSLRVFKTLINSVIRADATKFGKTICNTSRLAGLVVKMMQVEPALRIKGVPLKT